MKIAWWSAGITSAVACKLATELYDDVKLIYIETGAAHPDNARFKADCEKWYGQPIETIQNTKGYKNPIDVVLKTRYVNGPSGARCTLELKKAARYNTQALYGDQLTNQVFGFEFLKKEVNRAIRFMEQYPEAKPLFPLIERKLTKNNCAAMIINAHIELPEMYKLGYGNNNCIGCVKGGKGYWNKMRTDFPEAFDEMAKAERVVGHSCIKNTFLDKLDPKTGRKLKKVAPECGTFCDIEFADIEVECLADVMSGKISIYEAK